MSAIATAALVTLSQSPLQAADMPNACPVDGCEVSITSIEKGGDELNVVFDANYTPDNTKNHLHMWWGEQYKPEQVGRNAKSEHQVEQENGIVTMTTQSTSPPALPL